MRDYVHIEAESRRHRNENADELTSVSIAHDKGFLAGRTVTAEQLEAAAETLYEEFRVMDADIQPPWHELPRRRQYLSVMEAEFAFRAAGFLIEGDDQ